MQEIITKRWVLIAAILLGGMYLYGYQKMYFHQDDLDWLILANRPLWQVMSAPIGDHINYFWRVLLKIEWELFGFFYPPYLAVSILIHAIVIGLIYKLARLTSGRKDLAVGAALVFVINTNWTESILWFSGQTIMITALFVLLTMLSVWKTRGEIVLLTLASWTSALALGLHAATFLIYSRLRSRLFLIIALVGMIYYFVATDSTAIEISWGWMVKVGEVGSLMLINSVIGRLLIPFDRLEMVRIVIATWLMAYGLWRMCDKLREIWRDQWSRFLILQIFFYNLIVSMGRAQFGVGMMRAERYSYLGLALFLLLVVRVFREVRIGRWIAIVPVIIIVQIAGFWVRANYYVQRPQQLKNLVNEVQKEGVEKYNMEGFLPIFVLNDERLKYRDLIPLINH